MNEKEIRAERSKNPRLERAFDFNIEEFETRAESSGMLLGTAAVFNSWADIGWFEESIKKGAFEESLKKDDQTALVNHNSDMPIGSTRNKTLELWEEKDGLKCRIALNLNVSYARDLYENVANGLIDKMSFGFVLLREEWITKEDSDTDKAKSIILKARLFEVSPVSFPAYAETDIGLDRKSDIFDESNANIPYRLIRAHF